ncbi:MAG: rRNA maturation RNase YbeY [Omnitrophica bacterium RIFCSPLOWO2_01_FULL_45_24]|nr:MAG: rRNA maturation RNase YbeY [Omnitrophica bacterium RIFCSPHIGHO2_02_FULL_46_20]OGW93777.1 MAG: rRNA maturation RNase YbeY [Omnitrophica bacterium RIFCSPLOWO2_01_FULL_45_24]OGW94122.1 MAG: rRNA maturation RNase YbeY [Omnitrophica bacterium RIFCSPLOWO2_12_FULL_45_13]
MSIVVRNLNNKHRLNEEFIKELAADIIKILRKPRSTELEIIFLSDSAIRPLNRRYKNRNISTDVLSFELGELGEVIISSDTALRNSRIFNTSFEEEIVLYIIHGILHLFGYDDETAGTKNRMSKKENDIRKRLCGKENLSKVLTRR